MRNIPWDAQFKGSPSFFLFFFATWVFSPKKFQLRRKIRGPPKFQNLNKQLPSFATSSFKEKSARYSMSQNVIPRAFEGLDLGMLRRHSVVLHLHEKDRKRHRRLSKHSMLPSCHARIDNCLRDGRSSRPQK